MQKPRLNALRAFDAAARHLNFRLAGEELNVTQGAIAQSIRSLEGDLNVQLFHRLARGVALTEIGLVYHRDVAKGLAVLDRATENLQASATALTISVPPSFASKWLVPRLPYFFEAYPGFEVRTLASEAVTDFQVQDVDLAVRQGARPTTEDLVVTPLMASAHCIIGAPEIVARIGDTARLKGLNGTPLIQDGHRQWDTFLEARGGEAMVGAGQSYVSFNQTALAIDAAIQGQGLAIVPKLLVASELQTGRLVELAFGAALGEATFWLVHPMKRQANQKACDAFRTWLIAQASDDQALI